LIPWHKPEMARITCRQCNALYDPDMDLREHMKTAHRRGGSEQAISQRDGRLHRRLNLELNTDAHAEADHEGAGRAIAKALVDNPDHVQVRAIEGEHVIVFESRVPPRDEPLVYNLSER
jgi:hypothetical protein